MAYKKKEFDLPAIKNPNFRNLLAHVRRELGFGSMQALADHLGVSLSALDRIAKGETKNPRSTAGWGLQSIAIEQFGYDIAREIWEKT